MQNSIHRVSPGSAYPTQAVPKIGERSGSDQNKQFESELERQPGETGAAEENAKTDDHPKQDLHIAPLSEGDPGSILDLTA